MDLSFYKSIIDRIDFPTIVVPYANGEPTLHPDICDILDYTLSYNLKTYLTSNMTTFNSDLWDLCLSNEHYFQTIISLDGLPAHFSPSIEKTRPGSNRYTILNNIERLITLDKTMPSHTTLGIKICHRGQDWEEIENYIAYWLNHEGIDFVIVGEMLAYDDTPGMRIYPCQYSDDVFMMIRADGRLMACMYNDKVANHGMLTFGYLNYDEDLLAAYNNPAYTSFREGQRAGLFPPPCDTCGFAFTGSGFEGELHFRNTSLYPDKVYYHRDYYNHFYSKTKRIRSNSFYGYQWEPHAHLSYYTNDQLLYDGGKS